jgi:hypothetical protein
MSALAVRRTLAVLVVTSMILVLAGLARIFADGGDANVVATFHALRTGQPLGQALVAAGVLLLVVTPVVRVGFALAGFVRARDRRLAALSVLLLALLALAFVLGRAA